MLYEGCCLRLTIILPCAMTGLSRRHFLRNMLLAAVPLAAGGAVAYRFIGRNKNKIILPTEFSVGAPSFWSGEYTVASGLADRIFSITSDSTRVNLINALTLSYDGYPSLLQNMAAGNVSSVVAPLEIFNPALSMPANYPFLLSDWSALGQLRSLSLYLVVRDNISGINQLLYKRSARLDSHFLLAQAYDKLVAGLEQRVSNSPINNPDGNEEDTPATNDEASGNSSLNNVSGIGNNIIFGDSASSLKGGYESLIPTNSNADDNNTAPPITGDNRVADDNANKENNNQPNSINKDLNKNSRGNNATLGVESSYRNNFMRHEVHYDAMFRAFANDEIDWFLSLGYFGIGRGQDFLRKTKARLLSLPDDMVSLMDFMTIRKLRTKDGHNDLLFPLVWLVRNNTNDDLVREVVERVSDRNPSFFTLTVVKMIRMASGYHRNSLARWGQESMMW